MQTLSASQFASLYKLPTEYHLKEWKRVIYSESRHLCKFVKKCTVKADIPASGYTESNYACQFEQ